VFAAEIVSPLSASTQTRQPRSEKLGTRLFTRIKETNDRKLIEDFLAQP
jgi:hypothetical protein